MIRDNAMATSGLLVDRIGGPPAKPYEVAGSFKPVGRDKGQGLYRRSLYIFWRRIVGPTRLFDSGKRQTCEVKPTRTNTPLHALTTLNDGRLSIPNGAVGTAKQCLKIVREWASERVQWGHPIGRHEAIAQKLSDIAATTFAMESIVKRASDMANRADRDLRHRRDPG